MALMAAGLFALLAPRKIPRRLARVAIVAAATIAASAYVVVPIFRDFAYYNVSTLVPSWKYHSFGHAVVLGRLVRGELFDFGRAPVLTVLVGIGVVVAAIRARRDERSRFLLAVFAFFLLLYFGRPTWGKLLDVLPLGSGFHYSRALYLVHQAGATLAGVAAADLLQRLARVRRLGAATAVAAGVLVAAPLATERMTYLLHNAGLLQEAARDFAAERADLEAALALAREDRLGRTYAGFGRPGGPPWGGAFMVGWVPVYSWLPIREIDALGYLHHMWSLNADMHDGFDERRPDHYRVFNVRRILAPEGVATARFAEPLARFGRFRVLAVEGPGYVDLVDVPYPVNVPKRNVSRLHRAWLAGPLPAAGIHPAVRLLEEGAPIAGAYLADGADIRLPRADPPATPRGEVLSVERRGEDFLAEVRVDRPCHLLLKMSFHPGWRALVDGAPAETVQLMPSYVGVPLAPGTHRVELSWEPGALKGWLLAAGLLVLAATFGVERRRESGAGGTVTWKRRLSRVPWSVETYKLLKNARYAVRSRLRTEGGICKGGMSHAEAVVYVESIFRAFDGAIGGWAGRRVLECGPGDSLGVGVLALAKGATSYCAIDRFPVSFDGRRETAIFRDLLSSLPPEEKRRVEDVIALSPDGYRVANDRFRYFNAVSLEEASRRFGAQCFDVIFSNAVLEHVGDVASSLRSMRELLAPGGIMAHDVDLRSHQNFEKHELHFLEYSTALWRAMTSNTGEPNRVRLSEYRRILEDLGFVDVNIRVKSRFDPELVRRVRPRLAPQFRALSDEDLSVAVFLVTARAPR
jgi:SAM-dependent methyltransferase